MPDQEGRSDRPGTDRAGPGLPGDQGPRDSLNEPGVPADEVDRFRAGRGDGHGGDPESPFAPGQGGEGEVESWHQGTPPSR